MIDIRLSKELNTTISVKGIVSEVLENQMIMSVYGYAGQCGVLKRVV